MKPEVERIGLSLTSGSKGTITQAVLKLGVEPLNGAKHNPYEWRFILNLVRLTGGLEERPIPNNR